MNNYIGGQLLPAITLISSLLVYHIPEAAKAIKDFEHLNLLVLQAEPSRRLQFAGKSCKAAGAAGSSTVGRRSTNTTRTYKASAPRRRPLPGGSSPPGQPRAGRRGTQAVPARSLRAPRAAAPLPRPGPFRTARAPPPPAHCAGAEAPIGRGSLLPGRASSSRPASFPVWRRRPRSRSLPPPSPPRPVPPILGRSTARCSSQG